MVSIAVVIGGIIGFFAVGGRHLIPRRNRGPIRRHHRRSHEERFAQEAAARPVAKLEWDRNWYLTKCDTPWITALRIEVIDKELERRGHRPAPTDDHRRTSEDAESARAATHQAELAARVGAGALAVAGAGAGEGLEGVPDLIEPILGWRCWKIGSDGLLHALHGGGRHIALGGPGPVWEPRKAVVASCNSEHWMSDALTRQARGEQMTPHIAPMPNCSCGFYAARLLRNTQAPYDGFAYGLVALWGRVEEHASGWRAQYAYPVNLTIIADGEWGKTRAKQVLATIRKAYGVPTRIGTKEEFEALQIDQLETEPLPPQIAQWLLDSIAEHPLTEGMGPE